VKAVRTKPVLVLMLACVLLLMAGAADARAQGTTVEMTTQPTQPKTAPAKPAAPKVAARAWVLVDARSGKYLAGNNASDRLAIASTTKIMVALVALKEANLDEEVTVSEKAASFAIPIYSNVGLFPGDKITVRDLLKGTLISSGDDAVYALAQHLGGGSVEKFVDEMNQEAKTLGLKNTHFENPSGLDVKGHYSSAQDLATMTRLAFKYPQFREMVGTQYAIISTQDREIQLANTNLLLSSYPPATGVKTGTTPKAGHSLVASASSGNESYVAVFLDSQEDRFTAAARILEYGFSTYDRKNLVVRKQKYAEVKVPYRRGEKVGLVAQKDVEGLVDSRSSVKREAEVMKELPDSAKPGDKLGQIVLKVDGERVGESPLVAKKGYKKASLWERVWYTVGGVFQ